MEQYHEFIQIYSSDHTITNLTCAVPNYLNIYIFPNDLLSQVSLGLC